MHPQWPSRAPQRLVTPEFVLRPITADDAAADLEAVMESRADLVGWEQSGWPAAGFTVEENREDLAGLAADHLAGRRFTFTMVDPDDTRALGCVYVAPTSARFLAAADVVALGDLAWDRVGAAVYFWVRSSCLADGLEARLAAALRSWFTIDWPLREVVLVTTADFTRQVELLEAQGLHVAFEVREPGKPTPYLAFAAPLVA